MNKEDALLAAVFRRLIASDAWTALERPLDDEFNEVPDRWKLSIDGTVEISEEEMQAFASDWT